MLFIISGHAVADYARYPANNVWECVQLCSKENRCVAGDYWVTSNLASHPARTCYLHASGNAREIVSRQNIQAFYRVGFT